MAIFNFKKFVRSFFYAIRGFKSVLREQNFRIHTISALSVIVIIILFRLETWETVALLMMITLVLVLEIINSIFERIVNILEPRVHPHAKTIKDMMASAVLIASLGAFLVGFLILWPYFKNIVQYF